MKGSTEELIGSDVPGVYSTDPDPAYRSGQKGKTIVSFVVDEDSVNAAGKQGKERWHRTEVSYSPTQLVSILYCLVVSLIGLAAPITEALRDNWMINHVLAVFTVYMFVVSIVFLCYLLVVLSMNKRKKTKAVKAAAKAETSLSKTRVESVTAPGDVVLLQRNQAVGSGADGITSVSAGDKGPIVVNGEKVSQPSSPTSPKPSPGGFGLSSPSDQGDVFVVRRQFTGDDSRNEEGTSVLDLNPDSVNDVAEYLQLSAAGGKTHEGTSLYLRLGCLVFAIANMVYVGLEIEHYQGENNRCDVRDVQVYPIYFHLLFLIVQSFFLFKVSSFHVSKHKGFVSFGLMHVVATNMCVWLRFLTSEVMEGIHLAAHHDDEYEDDYKNVSDEDYCVDEESLLLQASPYLFPFILEYSLIAVATMLGMFAALHVRITKDTFQSVKRFLHSSGAGSSGSQTYSVSHEDETGGISFAKAHTGTFLGFVTLAGSLVSVVLFFFYVEQEEDHESAALLYHVTDMTLHTFMLIAVTIGIVRIFSMRYSLDKINMIDNVLLIISMAGLFLFELFIMFSAFWRINEDDDSDHLTVLDAVAALMSVIQAFLQTGFIFTGQQRYPSTDKERTQKPGRGAITFLIISNVSMWVFKMFQVKEVAINAHLNFYGNVAWPLIMNINLPLMLFYRFHSSVCLAEMWFSVYEEIEETMLESFVIS